jgi:hypothetical protein
VRGPCKAPSASASGSGISRGSGCLACSGRGTFSAVHPWLISPSIAEIPATTLRSLRTPPESPPLSRTASARRCGGRSTRHQSMVSTYGFAVGSPVARHYAMFPRSVCSTLRSSFRLLPCGRARRSFQLNHQRAKVPPGSRQRPAATNASVGSRSPAAAESEAAEVTVQRAKSGPCSSMKGAAGNRLLRRVGHVHTSVTLLPRETLRPGSRTRDLCTVTS